MSSATHSVESDTGRLFGDLWHRLTDEQYQQSVDLFRKRFEANGFDLGWFKGKRCLDAGTGSGRYALAMALHGASVSACDISAPGLETARERTSPAKIDFRQGSVLELPYSDAEFDFVCCAGVLHHTLSIERGLDELTRVLKPGGSLFLLLYGAGGLRWMMVRALRPWAEEYGYQAIDNAITLAGLPENNRKHFLDDLFVPILTQTKWDDLSRLLVDRSYNPITRWEHGQEFDHEADGQAQLTDMRKLEAIFRAFTSPDRGEISQRVATDFVETARRLNHQRDIMIGEGLHRVLAGKPS